MSNKNKQTKDGSALMSDVLGSIFHDMEMKSGICPIHGEYKTAVIAGHTCGCPQCMGVKLAAESLADSVEMSQKRDIARHDEMLAKAGVPERYRDKGFDNFRVSDEYQQVVFDTVKSYAFDFGQARKLGTCLIMSGLNGTGKSHLAVAVVDAAVNQGYSALFISALEALRSITSCYSNNSKVTQEEAFQKLRDPDLLVLDDIGTANDTDTTVQIIYEIIYSRYHSNKPTIITTNDSIEELNKLIGVRTVDRLRENSGKFLPFNWESIRGELK